MAEKKGKGKQAAKPTPKPAEPKKPEEPRVGKLYIRRDSAQRAAREDGLAPGDYKIEEEKGQFKYVYADSYKSMKEQMEERKVEPEQKWTPPSTPEQVQQHEDRAVREVPPTEQPKVEPAPAPAKLPVVKQLTPAQLYKQDLAKADERRRAEEEERRKKEAAEAKVEEKPTGVPVAPGQPPITTPGKQPAVTYSCPECKPPQSFADKKALLEHRIQAHQYQPKGKEGWLHRSEVESPTKAVWAIADEMKAENPKVTRKEVVAECERRGIAHWTARTQYQAWSTATRESEANAAKVNGNHKNNGKK